MQWSAGENAGFTSPRVKPWMDVNPDYVRVNAETQVKDPNSTYHYWASVLRLRKKYVDVFVYGDFQLLDKSSQNIFAYTRQYGYQKVLVLCHWTDKTLDWDAAGNGITGVVKDILLGNYEIRIDDFAGSTWSLRPYEAIVLLI